MQKFDVVSPQYRPLMLSIKALGTTGVKEVSTIQTVADTGVKEVQTLTFPDFATLVDRDYIVVEDAAGTKYAIYADKTGTSIAPTGAIYTAIPAAKKNKANVSTDTTAAEVAARFETAFNALTGFTAAITSNDTAADGTMTLTQTKVGPTVNPVPKDLNDGTAGTLAGVQTTAGVASNLNSSYFTFSSVGEDHYVWFNVNSEGVDPAVADTTGHEVTIAASANANTIATALELVMETFASSSAATDTVTVTNDSDGDVTDVADGADATGFTFAVSDQGVDSAVALTFGQFDATIAETSTGPGDYTITFNEPFVRAPQVAVSPVSRVVPRIVSVSTTALRIECNNLSGDPTDSDLNILVIGSQARDAI